MGQRDEQRKKAGSEILENLQSHVNNAYMRMITDRIHRMVYY